jgi:hypothetical protein
VPSEDPTERRDEASVDARPEEDQGSIPPSPKVEQEREILDEIVVQMEPRPTRSRLNATPSST